MLQRDDKTKNLGGLLHSPQLGSTGIVGTCIMFKYSMDGLSIAGLRVLLHVGVDEYSIKKEQTEEIIPENTTIPFCKPLEIFDERIIWNAQYYSLGVWQQTQMLYTYPDVHSVIKNFSRPIFLFEKKEILLLIKVLIKLIVFNSFNIKSIMIIILK